MLELIGLVALGFGIKAVVDGIKNSNESTATKNEIGKNLSASNNQSTMKNNSQIKTAPSLDSGKANNYGYSSSYDFLNSKSTGRVIYSKIAGVTMGANRQLYASRCYKGQELELVRERTNPYDSNAIAIYAGNNQLGYIKRDLAETLAKEIDRGVTFKCTVEEVTGGADKNYGVNIKLSEIN